LVVANCAGVALEGQETGGIAALGGSLGDQCWGQRVIEISDLEISV